MKTFLLLLAASLCLFTAAACSSRASSGIDGGRTLPELAPGGRLHPAHASGGRMKAQE